MPDYHVWVRKEDETIWNSIQDRPEWLHKKLQEEKDRHTRIDGIIKEVNDL
jgi:hypothetical protein